MPDVRFKASLFPSPWPNGSFDLAVSWAELEWAAITVGRWRDYTTPSIQHSFFEAVSRISLLWAYLAEDGGGRLERSAVYNELDPSEKSGISYALGMTMAKVYAARRLSTPWLMHVDRYRNDFSIMLPAGRSRPDLVGPQDPDNLTKWVVVEAKGRTNELDDEAISSMRTQKRRIVTVMGEKPVLFVGSAAHFSTGKLEVEVVDPPARGKKAVELFGADREDAKRRFVRAYYGPILTFLEEPSESRPGFVTRELPFTDVRVGLPAARFAELREYIDGNRDDVALGDESQDQKPEKRPRSFTGADGITVELGASWSDEMMMLQPPERAVGGGATG